MIALVHLADPAVGRDEMIPLQQDPADPVPHGLEVETVGAADTAPALENLHPSRGRVNTAFATVAACLA